MPPFWHMCKTFLKIWYSASICRTNFADILRIQKSSVKMECTDHLLISTSWAITWSSSMTIRLFVSACWWAAWVYLDLNWNESIFEAIETFLDPRFVHGLFAKRLPDLLKDLWLEYHQAFGKLDAIFLLDTYGENEYLTIMYYTSIL